MSRLRNSRAVTSPSAGSPLWSGPTCLRRPSRSKSRESVFLGEKSGEVGKALNVLHGLGIKVALDDFGTGYASLTHLRQYPVDLLKIDKSFIDDLEEDSGSHAIVSAVIDLAHRLGIRVVAEGVETSGQRTILASRNCDLNSGISGGQADGREPGPAISASARRG